MEDFVQQFLLKHKYCPLPSVGVLECEEGKATAKPGEQLLLGPIPSIRFREAERDAATFTKFIATTSNSTEESAMELLNEYCGRLKGLTVYQEMELANTGKFMIDGDGKLVFKNYPLPEEFLPAVTIQRVIRRDAIHQVRVGDTETTNIAMAEYYNGESPVVKSNWWIAAIVFALIAIAAVVVYMNGSQAVSGFGNAIPIHPADAPATYRVLN